MIKVGSLNIWAMLEVQSLAAPRNIQIGRWDRRGKAYGSSAALAALRVTRPLGPVEVEPIWLGGGLADHPSLAFAIDPDVRRLGRFQFRDSSSLPENPSIGPVMTKYPDLQLYIGGAWKKAAEGQPVLNPADESVIGMVPIASRSDLDAALAAAADGLEQEQDVASKARGGYAQGCAAHA